MATASRGGIPVEPYNFTGIAEDLTTEAGQADGVGAETIPRTWKRHHRRGAMQSGAGKPTQGRRFESVPPHYHPRRRADPTTYRPTPRTLTREGSEAKRLQVAGAVRKIDSHRTLKIEH